MKLPQVEKAAGAGPVHRWVCTRTRTCPLYVPVPTYADPEPGSVQVELTSVEPTPCGCAGGAGRVTHPADVAVEQPAAPAVVQLQILTVCCGTLVVSATHVVPVVPVQFLPLYVTLMFAAPAGSPVKVAYQSFASAVTTAPVAWAAAAVPSCPRATVQVVVPCPPVTCKTSLSIRM